MWDLCLREWARLVSALAGREWPWPECGAEGQLSLTRLLCETLHVFCLRDCQWGLNININSSPYPLRVKLSTIFDGEPGLWFFAWRFMQEIQTRCFLLGVGLGWALEKPPADCARLQVTWNNPWSQNQVLDFHQKYRSFLQVFFRNNNNNSNNIFLKAHQECQPFYFLLKAIFRLS